MTVALFPKGSSSVHHSFDILSSGRQRPDALLTTQDVFATESSVDDVRLVDQNLTGIREVPSGVRVCLHFTDLYKVAHRDLKKRIQFTCVDSIKIDCSDITNNRFGIPGETVGGGNLRIY